VWLPDRPGALGHVASAIGTAGGDVVGIEILERGGGSAIDELVVTLPDEVTLQTLINEIGRVEGVAVEDIRPIDPDRPDAGIAALEIAATLVHTATDARLERFCKELLQLVDGSWAVAMRMDDRHDSNRIVTIVEQGSPPDTAWLAAFLSGSRHLAAGAHTESTPGDVVWVHLESVGVAVASGRNGRPFHTRERQQVMLLGQIADGLMQPLD
jgi:ACT domain-containing protein